MSVLKRMTLLATVLLLLALTATPANNAEQVVFSATGETMALSGNTNPNHVTSTPFGFWIWCAAGAAPGSNGGYQNGHACAGNMYFYALNQSAKSVFGDVSEGPDGIYTMTVFSGVFPNSSGDFSCMLNNTTPDPKGPGNGVDVKCSFGASFFGGTGTANVTDAVVNVTGPK
jgi:hypothetical protein